MIFNRNPSQFWIFYELENVGQTIPVRHQLPHVIEPASTKDMFKIVGLARAQIVEFQLAPWLVPRCNLDFVIPCRDPLVEDAAQ